MKHDLDRFDGRVMSILCGRHFAAEWRQKMYLFAHKLPKRIKKRFRWEHILSSFFAGGKEE